MFLCLKVGESVKRDHLNSSTCRLTEKTQWSVSVDGLIEAKILARIVLQKDKIAVVKHKDKNRKKWINLVRSTQLGIILMLF